MQARLLAAVKDVERKVVDMRAKIAYELTEELMNNIPVWSGRTIASMNWSNNGEMKKRIPHPQRGGYEKEGKWRPSAEFGATSRMPLGSEPMRSVAEAQAMATLGSVDFSIDSKLTLTINSVPWSLVEEGAAGVSRRNKAVVSQIALATIRARYGVK